MSFLIIRRGTGFDNRADGFPFWVMKPLSQRKKESLNKRLLGRVSYKYTSFYLLLTMTIYKLQEGVSNHSNHYYFSFGWLYFLAGGFLGVDIIKLIFLLDARLFCFLWEGLESSASGAGYACCGSITGGIGIPG